MLAEALIKEQVCFFICIRSHMVLRLYEVCTFVLFRKWWLWVFDGMALVDRITDKLEVLRLFC